VKFPWQKLSINDAEVTPTTGVHPMSALILDSFQNLSSFQKCDKAMDVNPEDMSFHIAQYEEAFLQYVENECCAKQRWMSAIQSEDVPGSNIIPSAKASRFGQLSVDPYDWSSDDEENLMPKRMAEMTPGWSKCAAHLLPAARLHLNSVPATPKKWVASESQS